ncbi:MAG: hypothetical protein AABZ12_03630 [Planctomycetota bacterium]
MSLTAITLRVPYPADADVGDRIQAYTDKGSGTVDFGKPLLARPAAMFAEGTERFHGYGREVYGDGCYGLGFAAPQDGGHGEETYGDTDYAETAATAEITVQVPAAYRSHKFAVKLIDAEGNVQGGAAPEIAAMVASTDPPETESLSFDSYAGGRVKLAFTRNGE